MANSMDSYQLKWHSHANHLNGSVAALLRSERFTDVVLCTLDGCQIPAHKFILNSCSIYLSSLFESQRSSLRLGNSVVYVVLPSEITTKALQILIEYMYKGETTVSNDILDTVLKAGDLLKVRGLWRQNESHTDTTDKPTNERVVEKPTDAITKQVVSKKTENNDNQMPKISVKKDEKLLKTYAPIQHLNISRQSFIGPPKLVFIKTSDTNTNLRNIAPKPAPQTIIVTPDLQHHVVSEKQRLKEIQENPAALDSEIRDKKNEKKNLKRMKSDHHTKKSSEENKSVDKKTKENKTSSIEKTIEEELDIDPSLCDIVIKPEPDWDDESEIPGHEDMFHAEMTIKSELDMITGEVDDEEQVYSPLTCELCFEVFHIPAEWVRHIQGHAESSTQPPTRKRKVRSASDDTDETTALLRCDLCQKHFPNPGEWVRHIQSTHTETELAMCNNSTPPRRHNRYVDGDQKKTCDHCKKIFPSHASMVIHLRTHTGERPFICGLCNKGFNVKSNLLRHLRTLHDTIVSPGSVALLQDDILLPPLSPKDSSNDPLASTSAEQKIEDPS